ncbi:hypothetical protein ERO13_A09G208450v2 [Gossypium hirsutum]|uniref:Transcription factor bHLH77 n=1 Tax=Gossypium hirsutum TaxID=3635 RepID=A0A1U8MYP6_GOSHI|nr:transcription factor bHLH77-like [Gossypium hirsutum]KAG4185051.1 hypothetical protein ERO13_A09G208450v2 [Gossypium hirsutum]
MAAADRKIVAGAKRSKKDRAGKEHHGNGEKHNKVKSKAAMAPMEYVHVRARRGQATDGHSLAERVRREKISERMKLLQDLVPGCNKVTGKALMLDEIINYVQSLQCQVEVNRKFGPSPMLVFGFGLLSSSILNLYMFCCFYL